MTANKLAINRTKTMLAEVMIGQKRAKIKGNPPELTEHESDGSVKIIKNVKSCNLLGAKIQDNMTWREHMETGGGSPAPSN